MTHKKITDDIYYVGAQDFDRRLFDELIPLPNGTTYNSYIIKGSEKIALIDTVDPTKACYLKANLKAAGVEKIDYIISQHAEQDHSGSIPEVLKWFPDAKVVTNEKCKNFLIDLLQVPEDKFIIRADRETLSLGNKTLEFIIAPWVHWPETMFTYLKEDSILFSCDFLGSHFASTELFVKDNDEILRSAKRYYAEIMMPFRTPIKTHLEILKKYEIKMICPSHGPVYQDPKLILDAYQQWVSDQVSNTVVLPYISMHGSTQIMVDRLIEKLSENNVEVKPFNLSRTDIGELAMALVDAATLVLGTPTVLAGPHPKAVYAAYLANALRPKTRFASVIGSYGWGGRTVESVKGLLSGLKVELIEPVIIKGVPKADDLKLIDALAEAIIEKHKTI